MSRTGINKTITIRLTSSGSDTDNFNIYESYTQSDNIIATGVSRSSLLAGATFGINPYATGYLVESTGGCNTVHTVTFPTTTTTTTTTLSYYSWVVQMSTLTILGCSTTPGLTAMCDTNQNAYTKTVYTKYGYINVGTKVYLDTGLSMLASAAGYKTIRTLLSISPTEDNLDYTRIYTIKGSLGTIGDYSTSIKCCGCSGLPPC
jgi:hypothetical protein